MQSGDCTGPWLPDIAASDTPFWMGGRASAWSVSTGALLRAGEEVARTGGTIRSKLALLANGARTSRPRRDGEFPTGAALADPIDIS